MNQSISISNTIRRVHQLIQAGNIVGAIGQIEPLLEPDPSRRRVQAEVSKLYPLHCKLCVHVGELDRGMQWVEKALDRDDTLELHLQAAVQDLSRKRRPEAMIIASALTRARPNSGGNWIWLGVVSSQLSRFAEAEEAFRRALALDEACDDACVGLANCYLAQGRSGDAGKLLRVFTERGHPSREVQEGLQLLYNQRALLPEDAAYVERQLLRHKARVSLNLGWMHYAKGEREEAVARFKEALQVGGKDPQIYLDLRRAVTRCTKDEVPEAPELGRLVSHIREEVVHAS